MAVTSESAILCCLDRYFENSGPAMELGRGDDCAFLGTQGRLCVSSDLFMEDIHFRSSYFPPQAAGYKALAVNLSDLAACGASPLAFSLCLAIPPWVDIPWLEIFFSSMAALANRHNLLLCGGDISKSEKLHIAITIFGRENGSGTLLRRDNSRPGDAIFVIGQLGLARIALMELELGRNARIQWPRAWRAHLFPEAQVEAGLKLAALAANLGPISLMDVSDGIATDLPRLLGKFGAALSLEEERLHPEVIRHAGLAGEDPCFEAIKGGEDYALLGTCHPDVLADLQREIPALWRIGTVRPDPGIVCNGMDITGLRGFDHFGGQTSAPRSDK